MALRTGHGAGKGAPRIEVLPVDELPTGLPDPSGANDRKGMGANGRFLPGNSVSARGGRAGKGKTALAKQLLISISSDPAFKPYLSAATSFRRMQVNRLASMFGGGECGPAPSSMVASASLQLAASRWAFEHGEYEAGSKLANDSRQNLLAAHELAAKEALARPKKKDEVPWLVSEDEAPKVTIRIEAAKEGAGHDA